MEEKIDNQKLILKLLKTRPISFNPELAKLTGNVTNGLFLSQILYWSDRGRDPQWIYKTVKEFQEETLLSKGQQLRAQTKCVELGILEVRYKRVPRTRHFRVKVDHLIELLKKNSKFT